MDLKHLSNEVVLSSLTSFLREGDRLTAKVITYLVEVEERRLYLELACSSMFAFCTRRLGLSEGEAYSRLAAARLVRRFPTLLEAIASGRIHLTNVMLLRDLFSESTLEELIEVAAGKTKREVEEIVARRAPKPDVPASIRKLPELAHPHTSHPATPKQPELACPAPRPSAPPIEPAPASAPPRPKPAQRLEPLSEARYKLTLTATAALKEKLERARALTSHKNPSGDLAVVVEQALEVLIEKLEKERLGKTSRPQTPRRTKTDHVTRAVRRAVFARDGEQCSFVSDVGDRCPARLLLELDHVVPRALGGASTVGNLRVRCRGHNQHWAEQVFGREHVARQIHLSRRRRFPVGAENGQPESTSQAARCREDGAEPARATSPHDGA